MSDPKEFGHSADRPPATGRRNPIPLAERLVNVEDRPWAEVTQSILHDAELAEHGVYGNCMQAAVASVLRLPMDAVPHFVTFEWWPQALTLWAYGRGLSVGGAEATAIPDDGRVYMVGGKSERGVSHVVVGYGGEVVWDPHPSRSGLISIRDVTWFEPLAEDETCPLPWGPVHAAHTLERLGYVVIAPNIEEAS